MSSRNFTHIEVCASVCPPGLFEHLRTYVRDITLRADRPTRDTMIAKEDIGMSQCFDHLIVQLLCIFISRQVGLECGCAYDYALLRVRTLRDFVNEVCCLYFG